MAAPLRRERAAQRSAEVAHRHVVEQRGRIERQRALLAQLEDDGHTGKTLLEARELLKSMLEALHQMIAHQRQAQARAGSVDPLDEESLDHVARNCPL